MDVSVRDVRKPNPREEANILSLLTFGYTLGLFRKGFKKDLQDEDVYEVVKSCQSTKLGDMVEDKWEKQKKSHKKASIYRLLWASFGMKYMFLGMLHLVWKLLDSILGPEALRKVVSHFESNKVSKEQAIIYASILIALKFSYCFYFQNYMIYLQSLGIQMRASLNSLIYRKSLKLTPTALLDINLGNIVTLVTKDVNTFEQAIWLLNEFWIAIIQSLIVIFLIYSKIGAVCFYGIGVLFVSLPLQLWLSKIIGNLRMGVNKKTDERLQITQESLSAIKIIKMYVWTTFFDEKITDARKAEIKKLMNIFYLKLVIILLGILCSKLGFYVLIITYVWSGSHTSAELIFYLFLHFHTLNHQVGIILPMALGRFAEVFATLSRINKVFQAEELKTSTDTNSLKGNKAFVEIKNATVMIKDKAAIENICLTLEPGLTVVTGHLGCGKSSLLKTILKDYPMTSGDLRVCGKISYASQDPWLFPASIKQNILFGEEFVEARYKEVIKVCALEFDFDLFENRDETIVADRGLNLSKGQQARINLARAVYKNSDIYLLDDSLTALDPKVQDYIFKECIQGYLKNKECICVLVTHNTKHIKQANKLVIMDNGSIKFSGTPKEIGSIEILKYIEPEDDEKMLDEEVMVDDKTKMIETELIVKKNIYREIKKEGGVKSTVYLKYIQYGGGVCLFSFIIMLYTISQFAESYSAKVLTNWVDLQKNISKFKLHNDTDNPEFQEIMELSHKSLNLYSILTLSSTVLDLVKYYIFLYFAMKASIRIHKKMIQSVVNTVMSFFDNHFIGNILNRFSQDMNVVDEYLPIIITQCVRIFFTVFGMIFLIASVNWKFIFPCIAFVLILIGLRMIYMPTGRSLKRLESASRSPMVGHLNASLEGITTIRAYKNQDILRKEFDRHQDLYTSTNFMLYCMNRSFGFFMDFVAAIYCLLIIVRLLIEEQGSSAGKIGLAITQSLALAQIIQWGLMQLSELENLMTSVERLLEYTILPQEYKEGKEVENWPKTGAVQYQKVSLTYSSTNEKVLKNITFSLGATEKIGIVGRTGAGKSSIIATLFRLYNFDGQILIDNVDTKILSLDFLREHISIIPQDPILFAGTVRSNIDPLGKYTDEEIWAALEKVYMKQSINSLDVIVNENDSVFSTGQRQLICIARAIIRKNKIVVLDEATANMDPDTEALIQKTIDENFCDCTVFIIAHRLQSVLRCHKVMVMDRGEIAEFDDPMTLLENKIGTFYNMVKQAGLLGSLE